MGIGWEEAQESIRRVKSSSCKSSERWKEGNELVRDTRIGGTTKWEGILWTPTYSKRVNQAWCFPTLKLAKVGSFLPLINRNPGNDIRRTQQYQKGGSIKNLTDNRGQKQCSSGLLGMSLPSPIQTPGSPLNHQGALAGISARPARIRRGEEKKGKNGKTKALKINVSLEPLTKVDQNLSAEPEHSNCQLK